MTVPLPRSPEGDSTPIPIHHQIRSQETRKPLNSPDPSYNDPKPNNLDRIDSLYFAKIKAQARHAIQTSKLWSKKLESFRARLKREIDEGGKKPPDPGPPETASAPIEAVNCRNEEREESQGTAMVMGDQLPALTGLNQGSNRPVMVAPRDAISTASREGRITNPNPIRCNPPPPVHTRCLCVCLMASTGNRTMEEVSGRNATRPIARDAEFRRRAGKGGAGSSTGSSVLVVDMASARQAVRARFMAVGLFLSVLLANSQQVIDHMRRVWKIRGVMEANQVEAGEGQRKFVLEFSEEGDRDHVVRGGPWQYKGDAFLVEGLEVGADPATALFTHIPMWIQFRNIPFYLLTKKLARELGEHVGTLIKIDNNARGNICDKFLRARVQLPLYMALQREIILMDEITVEEVAVQLRYERLPNFCLFCGYIGHMEARCDAPAGERKICFNQELRVQPVHFEDPRTWFLPEEMGKQNKLTTPTTIWRAQGPAPWPAPWEGVMPQAGGSRINHPLQAVEKVAEEVAKLCVDENSNKTQTGVVITPVVENKELTVSIIDTSCTDITGVGETAAPDNNLRAAEPTKRDTVSEEVVAAKTLDNNTGLAAVTPIANGNKKGWKRRERDLKGSNNEENLAPADQTQQQISGRVRNRTEEEEDEIGMMQVTKRGTMQPPTLSECLGEEGLQRLRQAELEREVEQDLEERKKAKEATGPGAAGPLSGADVGAWQAQ